MKVCPLAEESCCLYNSTTSRFSAYYTEICLQKIGLCKLRLGKVEKKQTRKNLGYMDKYRICLKALMDGVMMIKLLFSPLTSSFTPSLSISYIVPIGLIRLALHPHPTPPPASYRAD